MSEPLSKKQKTGEIQQQQNQQNSFAIENEREFHSKLTKFAASFSCSLEDKSFAKNMDSIDPFKQYRDKFYFPKAKHSDSHHENAATHFDHHQSNPTPPITSTSSQNNNNNNNNTNNNNSQESSLYLCGNSLGLQPKSLEKLMMEELQVWRDYGVEGHFDHPYNRPWLKIDENVLEQSCRLVGAETNEVAVMNSLSLNIHLLFVPFYRPNPKRFKILIEWDSFPSDLYVVQSQARFHGYDPELAVIQLKARPGEHLLRTEDILEVIEKEGDTIAVVLLPGVQYYTGQYFEIEKITAAAHKKGCMVGWDLAHAAGNVVLKLHDWNVDFAAWCSYKYLNSGPGSIAGAFVHAKHAEDKNLPRFAAWWGHDLRTRFEMREKQFHPIAGAFGFRISNPPVVCVVSLLASLQIFDEVGIQNLRSKSVLLTGYLEHLLKTQIGKSVEIITPSDPTQRGCQLSLIFQIDVSALGKRLSENGVICDVRKPHVLRVAPTPLYNSFQDVFKFVEVIKLELQQ